MSYLPITSSERQRVETLSIFLVLAALGCGQGPGSKTQTSTAAPRRTAPPLTVATPTTRTTPSVTPVASATPIASPAPAPVVTPPPPPPPAPAPPPSFELEIDAPSWSAGTLFVACDLPVNGKSPWSADAFPLTMDPLLQGRWHGVMTVTSGAAAITSGTTITFKITRGGWNTVEKGPLGEEVPNRVAVCGNGPTRVFAHVFHWADDQILPPAVPTRELGYFMPLVLKGPKRQVFAHVPPGYDDPANATRRYPVLYALDGQTLLDASRSPTGKTVGLDGAADLNSASGHADLIVVAIDGTFQKFWEFGPTFDPVLGTGGRLEDFGDWIFSELKPEIDRVFRTKPDSETTGLFGTGLAGLAAFRYAWNHPDRVKLVAALSPETTWNQDETKNYVKMAAKKPKLRVWLDAGTGDGAARLQSVRDVESAMVGVGFTVGGDLHYLEAPGGTLDEASWGARVKDVVGWMFP